MHLIVNELVRIRRDALLPPVDPGASEPAEQESTEEASGTSSAMPADYAVFRLIWLSDDAKVGYAIDIDAKHTTPVPVSMPPLYTALDEGEAELVTDDPKLRLPAEDSIEPKQRDRRNTAWSIVAPLVADEPKIYLPAKRGAMIRAAAEAHGCADKTLRRWLQEYWQGGLTKNALLTHWERCGGRDQVRAPGDAKRGRPRVFTPGIGLNITEPIKRIFRVAWTHYYLRNSKASLQHAYDTMLRKFFANEVEQDERNKLRLKDPDKVPTIFQFKYWYEKVRNVEDESRSRKGRRHFERNERPLLSNSTVDAYGPGARFQIDATVADVYLVSRDDPTKIVGRPVIYVVIDVWSRLIVGLYVGIENASWVTAMMAIVNAASDKVAFCKDFGIDITRDQWPAHHLAAALLGDRGEMEAPLVERLSALMKVDPENAAPYRADWKGVVERRFRTLQAVFAPLVLGYIEPDYQERGGTDYRLDATLNVYEFTQVMIEAVLEHNAAWIDKYPIDPELVRADVPPIPNELWRWGIQHRSGKLRSYPIDKVKFALMPVAQASVTAKGIEFVGRCYTCDEAIRRRWFTIARTKKSWKVSISFDPRCIDEILVHDEDDAKRYYVCTLTPGSNWGHGLSLQEVAAVLHKRKKQEGAATHQQAGQRVNRDRNIDEIVARAAERKAKAVATANDDKPPSKAARTRDIRPNRAEERAQTRAEEAFRFADAGNTSSATVVPLRPETTSADASKSKFAMPSIFKIREES